MAWAECELHSLTCILSLPNHTLFRLLPTPRVILFCCIFGIELIDEGVCEQDWFQRISVRVNSGRVDKRKSGEEEKGVPFLFQEMFGVGWGFLH